MAALVPLIESLGAGIATAAEALSSFFGAAEAGIGALAEGLEGEEAVEAGAEDSWRSRIVERASRAGESVRNNVFYKKLMFYSTMSFGIDEGLKALRMMHKFEKSALSKAEHSWKSVSDKVRHGHWFSTGHGHAMNGVTQGNYDFIVRRKRKHY